MSEKSPNHTSEDESPLSQERRKPSAGLYADDEVNSTNYKDWLRDNWPAHIEQRCARRNEASFWELFGFEEIEKEQLAGTGLHMWRKRDDWQD